MTGDVKVNGFQSLGDSVAAWNNTYQYTASTLSGFNPWGFCSCLEPPPTTVVVTCPVSIPWGFCSCLEPEGYRLLPAILSFNPLGIL